MLLKGKHIEKIIIFLLVNQSLYIYSLNMYMSIYIYVYMCDIKLKLHKFRTKKEIF